MKFKHYNCTKNREGRVAPYRIHTLTPSVQCEKRSTARLLVSPHQILGDTTTLIAKSAVYQLDIHSSTTPNGHHRYIRIIRVSTSITL